jgi:putative transposase
MFRLGKERVKLFMMDETEVEVGGEKAFLFVAYEPFAKRILGLYFAWNANSIAVESFLKDLIEKYEKRAIWTDGGTWYVLACESMKLDHHVYVRGSWMFEVMERQIQKLKDRTESFDDLFPYCYVSNGLEKKCGLKHVFNWINMLWLHLQPSYLSVLMAGLKDVFALR